MLEQQKPVETMRPVVVLLAEDEFLIRALIADEIRQLGWQVIETASADEAIEVINSEIEFDIVLTDVHMPGTLDGLALAKIVRERRPWTKIAVMSGHFIPEPGIPVVFDSFISKPSTTVVNALRELASETGAGL